MTCRLLIPVLGAGVLLSACEAPPTAPDAAEPSFAMEPAEVGSTDVFQFGDPPTPIEGSSRIVRNRRGVSVALRTTGLGARYAYTMWAVVFNEPDLCSDQECGEDDLENPDAVVDVLFVTGNLASPQGTSNFAGHLKAGYNTGSLFAKLGAPAPGLVDPRGAEIHLVVRSHGPAIPGMIPEQIHSFEGGCTPASSLDLGTGSYDCEDVQFAVHKP